ncbi:hypothetical protein DL93DRAFT_2092356 [Clavulina sp. PMI_390]|nr:hypothetical protein DL93DRAFT_2092356 [Clavulina sp. PMI_390]
MASAIFSLPCDLSRVKSFALATIYAIDSDGRDDDPRKQPIKIGSTSNTSFSPSRFRVNSALALTFPDFDGSNLDTLYVADEYLGHPEILRLLSRSANAQRMHLQVRDPRSLFPHPLTFPRLLFLSTLSKWPTQRFHAPSLRKLVITRPWLMRDSQAWLGLSAGLPHLQHLTLYDVDKSCYVSKVELLFSMMTHIPQLFTLELKQWFVRWLLQFAVASPITPASTADTEWLAPLKTSLSANNPASGSNDYNRHQSNLDPTLPGPTMFLPNLQLLILSSSEDKADGDALFRDDLDTGLQNILRARPTLSLHYNGSFMTGSNGSIEEAQALLRESMELGHMHQSDRREHGRIYSGLQNDIVV